MKKLGQNLERLIGDLSENSEQALVNLRAHQVRARYRQALESVYRNNAQLFLDHTNNVYIMKKDEVNTLIVYVDESIYAAELNAQRELIKLKLMELFKEEVEEFKIYVSRAVYKDLHPYAEKEDDLSQKRAISKPLSREDKENVRATAGIVDNKNVRESLEKAMTANIAREKAENDMRS